MSDRQTRLYQSGKIGGLEIRNRIIMAPMYVGFATEKGYVTDRLISFYEARARGGVGLIITGGAYVIDISKMVGAMKHLTICEDGQVDGLRKMVEAIKVHGAKVFIQLIYPAGKSDRVPGPPPRVGSPIHELPKDEIERRVEVFVQAARRAKQAHFDGVEVHGAHGYLVSQFLSPRTNLRTDEYGGDAAKRATFACQIIRSIKQELGHEFPVSFRMNGDDCIAGGLTINEAVVQARLLVEAGTDALSLSASIMQGYFYQIPTVMQPSGCLAHLAAAVKKEVAVPVITAGKLGDPIVAETVLKESKADFIAMGRPLLADPELPNKARQGKLEDICPCICCNLGCSERRTIEDMAITCSVNPLCGMEQEGGLPSVARSKRVMVVGGGLAGMEAAITMAKRGHDVSLFEAEDKLGGQWNIVATYHPDVSRLVRYLSRNLEKTGVKVLFKTNVDYNQILKESPEVIVIATGAKPTVPEVPGIHSSNVVMAWDVLTEKVKVGQEVVIIGGHLVGLETACLLAKNGKKVSVVEMLQIGHGLVGFLKWSLKDCLIKYGVYQYPGSTLYSVNKEGIDIIDEQRQLLFLKADTVVIATGSKPQTQIAEVAKQFVKEVHIIGDAVKPRQSLDAIHEGFKVGCTI